jgi:hypothetical protein
MFSGTPASMPKKLFAEPEVSSTQDNMEELLGLCSGRFTGEFLRCCLPGLCVISHMSSAQVVIVSVCTVVSWSAKEKQSEIEPSVYIQSTCFGQRAALGLVVLSVTGCSCPTGNIGVLVDPATATSHTSFEEELLGLCSGKFISQPVNLHSLEKDERHSQPSDSPSK